jgi:DNA-binding MarR family transcriptional regulator
MTRKQPADTAYLAIVKFLMLSKRRIGEIGNEFGLTHMQTLTLYLLDEPRPMNTLRKIFNCDASNITGLIDALEQKGLAVRYENEADRRIKCAKLAPKGEQVRTEILHKLGRQQSPLLSRLSVDEYDVFIGLMEKITEGDPLGTS